MRALQLLPFNGREIPIWRCSLRRRRCSWRACRHDRQHKRFFRTSSSCRFLSTTPTTATSDAAHTKKVTSMMLSTKKQRGERISMVTAYDYPSALHVERAGIDVLLVGDSVGMVELGWETTQPVTMDHMLHHCRAVANGARHPLLVGDMPFGSYEINDDEALRNAYRFIKDGRMDCIKLEGGRTRVETIRKIVKGGIAVMGHIGLTPQAISVLGGFRAQGRTAVKARALLDDALELQDAGVCALVIECVPAIVGEIITDALEIPTIGIGAGPHTTGQVLVFHDLLGLGHHPHYAAFTPQFCKQYADVGGIISDALRSFHAEVKDGVFPDLDRYSPYKMNSREEHALRTLVARDREAREKKSQESRQALVDADEYHALGLYGSRS